MDITLTIFGIAFVIVIWLVKIHHQAKQTNKLLTMWIEHVKGLPIKEIGDISPPDVHTRSDEDEYNISLSRKSNDGSDVKLNKG